ncbi:barstar family protein [Lysobacter sp. A3-1-A15]|uniref:barstar family protein n=1 Tax=Novilysobacter viscosus TaxID=3098602 RepID=UPI002ED7E6AC
MNGIDLRSLLADPSQAGTYFVDARDRLALAEAATALDFAVATVDLAGCVGKDDAIARLAGALGFPDWFGGNWDALADALGDLAWWPAAGHVVLLVNAGPWREAHPEEVLTLVSILDGAADAWRSRRHPFWALWPVPADTLEQLAP